MKIYWLWDLSVSHRGPQDKRVYFSSKLTTQEPDRHEFTSQPWLCKRHDWVMNLTTGHLVFQSIQWM